MRMAAMDAVFVPELVLLGGSRRSKLITVSHTLTFLNVMGADCVWACVHWQWCTWCHDKRWISPEEGRKEVCLGIEKRYDRC